MTTIKSEPDIRKTVERQIREDSADKILFKGSKLKRISDVSIEPMKDSFGHYVSYKVEGHVEVDMYSEDKHSYIYPKRGKRAFSMEFSASGEMTKHHWEPTERAQH